MPLSFTKLGQGARGILALGEIFRGAPMSNSLSLPLAHARLTARSHSAGVAAPEALKRLAFGNMAFAAALVVIPLLIGAGALTQARQGPASSAAAQSVRAF